MQFVYLIPTSRRDQQIALLDRETRRLERENEALRVRLLEAGKSPNSTRGSDCAVAQDATAARLHAVREGAKIVQEDIHAMPGMKNVRRGTALVDDIERKLVPPVKYLHELPLSMRVLLATAFNLDTGLAGPINDQDPRPSSSIAGARTENIRKREHNRAYFLAIMCLSALLRKDYRAPHELMLSQALKSHGTSRVVIDFLAMLGLCISERGRYDREEVVVRNLKDATIVPPNFSIVAAMWDNNDMKPTMNLLGQDYVSFIAASCVGVSDRSLRLSLESQWKRLEDLDVETVLCGLPRDHDSIVFNVWRKLLNNAAYSCFEAGDDAAERTCLEVELRRVRSHSLENCVFKCSC